MLRCRPVSVKKRGRRDALIQDSAARLDGVRGCPPPNHTTYKKLMEANKKEGLITGYAVYSTQARSPQEPDSQLIRELVLK